MAFDMDPFAFDPLNDTPRGNKGKPPSVAIPSTDASWVQFDIDSPAASTTITSRNAQQRHHKRAGTRVALPMSMLEADADADDLLHIPTSQVRGHGRTRSMDSPMGNPFDLPVPATETPINRRHVSHSIAATSGGAAAQERYAKGARNRRRSSLPTPFESPKMSKIDRVFFPENFGGDDSDAEEYDRPTSPSPPPPAPRGGVEPASWGDAGTKTPKHHVHHKHRHRHHRRRHADEYSSDDEEEATEERASSDQGHRSRPKSKSRSKKSSGKQRLKLDVSDNGGDSKSNGEGRSSSRKKKSHRRAASAMSPVAPPPGHHFWAKLDIPAVVPKQDSEDVAAMFSPRTKERQRRELDEFDSESDGEEYTFDTELDAWRPKNDSSRKAKSSSGKTLKAQKSHTRRRSSQPCVPGVSANSAEHVHMRLQNLQFGVEIVDTEKFLAGSKQRILFVQRGYFRGDWLERLDFIFESSHATPVVVGVKIFKHGPNIFKTPTDQILNYRKNKYFKWKVDPGDRLHCLTATRAPEADETQKKSNKMGFSYLVGHKYKTKWYWS